MTQNKTCEICGYEFETDDIVREVAFRSSEYEVMCDVCYTQVMRRNQNF